MEISRINHFFSEKKRAFEEKGKRELSFGERRNKLVGKGGRLFFEVGVEKAKVFPVKNSCFRQKITEIENNFFSE